MIALLTAKDFREALVDLIQNKAHLTYDAHFNHVNKTDKSYVWIELRPQKTSWDKIYFQRVLNVYIYVVLFPDKNAEVKHTDLMDISDALDAAIHYEFTLDFTDCVPSEEYEGLNYELMRNLEVDLNKKTSRRIFIKEADESENVLPDPSAVIQDLLEHEGDD